MVLNADTLLDRLADAAAQVERATTDRNRRICDLHDRGVSLRVIAEAAGLTHSGVAKIVAKPRSR